MVSSCAVACSPAGEAAATSHPLHALPGRTRDGDDVSNSRDPSLGEPSRDGKRVVMDRTREGRGRHNVSSSSGSAGAVPAAGTLLPHTRSRRATISPLPASSSSSSSLAKAALLALLVLLCGCYLPLVVEAAMTFNPANAVEASLYQVLQLNLNSNPLQNDPVITVGDRLYFIAATTTTTCTYIAPGSGTTPTFSVTVAGTGGYTGRLDVSVLDTVFTVGTSYVACYLSTSAQTATLMQRQTFSGSTSTTTSLLVWPPLYSSFTLDPALPSGGEGVVNMSVTQVAQTNRPTNAALVGSYTVFLPPCGAGSSTGVSCTDPNALTPLCASIGRALISSPSTSSGVVQLGSLRWSSTTVTGGFTVPYAPNSAGYYVCVPYCHDSSAGCGSGSVAMGYALVSTTAGTPSLASFAAANPGTYTRTPTAPQAREQGTIAFTSSGLSASDSVKVVGSSQSCTSPTASLLGNIQIGAVSFDAATATTQVSFVAPNLVDAQIVGKVCYRRASTGLWSTAYLSASNPVADFTIDVLQPSSFTVAPLVPTVGQDVTLFFTGTGLSASQDLAFLTASQSTNPCEVTTGDNVYPCTMGGGATSPTCTAVVDPAGSNQAMQLSVCYRKMTASVASNYAQLRGSVSLAARNPLYAASPYPIYAGQTANLTFTGTGMSASDEVVLIPQTQACATGSAIAGATLTLDSEVASGTEYRYTLVGVADVCARVCYRFAGTTEWVVTQAAVPATAVSASCPAEALYIAPYPIRYTLGLPTGTSPTAQETLLARFTSITGTLSSHTLQSVRLVQAANTCVTAPCVSSGGGATTTASAACAKAASAGDYVGPVVAASGTAMQATVMAASAGTAYVVCVLDSGAGTAYIPVLATTATSSSSSEEDTSDVYSFTTEAANAQFASAWPSTWHVAMAAPTATFTGSGLNAATDVIYAVAQSVLLSSYVCPTPGTAPTTALNAAINASLSTDISVTATFTRSDRLYTGATVYFCYQWSTSGVTRVSYAGSRTVEGQVPVSVASVGAPASGYKATDPVTLEFANNISDTVSLSASADAVYFYRYDASSNPNPGCYCSPSQCSTGTRVSYTNATLTTSATEATSVTFTNLLGFDNYNADAVYIVCYTVSALSRSDTYMGRINVARANPAYYTVSSVAGTDNRVGAPITITARGCLGTSCAALSDSDAMLLIPSTTECAQVTSQDEFASTVQLLGSPTIATGSRSYAQRFVVDAVGSYRVCYRLASSGLTTFNELVFSSSYLRQTLTVTEADPVSFATTPTAPSAGQFTTVDLDCNTSGVCAACATLRLLSGARADCWDADNPLGSDGSGYTSANCLTTQSIQFPDQYFAAGEYTLCYGSDLTASRRLPGTLTVTAANPSSYVPDPATVRDIYTNQASDFVLAVTGSGLQTGDEIFLMPELGYTCHDLRTEEMLSNGTIAGWLTPSVDPLPITPTATGATWVASTQSRRFGAGMLSDTLLCGAGADGQSCDMKLCYRRAGTTWAPVPIADDPVVRVVASNPASVTFDRYPLLLDLYTMATVAGSGLAATDVLSVHAGASCTGETVTVLVTDGAGYVSADGTEWMGVVRFNNSAFASYTVCYWRGSSATEIVDIRLPGQTAGTADVIDIVASPLYFALFSENFTESQSRYPISRYEEMILIGTFYTNAQVSIPLSAVRLISSDATIAECNYAPYYEATGLTAPFPVVEDFSAVASAENAYQARLVAPVGSYALCMESADYGLFRVVSAPPDVTRLATASTSAVAINEANPATYTSAPTRPSAGQLVNFTFVPTTSATVTGVEPAALAVGDEVHVIDGTLYECGFPNATAVIATGVVAEVSAADGSASASVQLPDSTSSSAEEAYVGADLTVCYRKTGGTFATVPRVADGSSAGTLVVDRNLHISPQIPAAWASEPEQIEELSPVSITFIGNASEPDYLTTSDVAFLVDWPEMAGTDTPTSASCASAAPALSSSGTALVMDADAVNTTWEIPAGELVVGRYIVCYTATANGSPVYVSSPQYLTVYPLQSPTGAYTYAGSGLSTFRGQRLYLFFNTTEALDVVLDDGLTPAASLVGRDVVTISSTLDCANPLAADDVAAIPTSFGYATLTNETTTLPDGTVIVTPYLMLRVRAAAGTYYVCMQRANRASWQAYYTPRIVGGAVNPAVLTVVEAPITAFTTTPPTPRAWVNQTAVSVTYSGDFALANVAQLFFVNFTGESTSASDEMLYDACYLPPTRGAASSESVALVDNTLAVTLSTMTLPFAFDAAGTYLLCYQLITGSISGDTTHVYIASVFPSALTVANPSPISYSVPSILATGTSFTMTFAALDAIFAAANANQAVIYALPEGTAPDTDTPPSCEGATPPTGGGQTSFTSFTIASGTSASVAPLVNQADYFFVCFLTYDQTHPFAVPNAAGGYVFSVGLTGAMSYVVHPSPAYLGQQLQLTIYGNELSSSDRAKVVLVSSETLPLTPSSSSGSTTAGDYTDFCTADAVNADASVGGTEGSAVSTNTTGLVAHYGPRMNATGTFVLCYQSAVVGNTWKWVSDINSFSVYAARPTNYAILPDPVYETQVGRLIVYDSASTTGALSADDEVKLVASPAAGSAAFVCTADAEQSSDVGLVAYVAAESSSTQSVYRVCASMDVQVTVCYRLASAAASATSTGGWAEVPLSSPPPSYEYAPVSFQPDPFTGPILSPTTLRPRPYERFNFSFTSSATGVEVTFVGFSAAPLQTCALAVTYITPTFYEKTAAAANSFVAALPAAGDYVLHLGMTPQVSDPNITHATLLTIGSCDPCTVAPTYTFLGETATLTFPSGSAAADSLSTGDELRLVPTSVGLAGIPCEETQAGPFANQTFLPTTVGTGGASASFLVVAGTVAEADAYLGEYFLCYKKATDAEFAVVANNAGDVATFAIYPVDLVTVADMCPEGAGNVFALETVVFNLTVRDLSLYPNADFSANDEFVLVPVGDAASSSSSSMASSSLAPSSSCESVDIAEQRVINVQLDNYGPGYSNWFVTLPYIEAETAYLVCFRMQYDTVLRNVLPAASGTSILVQPANPHGLSTSPPVILPTSTSPRIIVTGTGLQATDSVYLVPANTSCDETCDHPITPVEWASTQGVTFTKLYYNSTTVNVDFSAPIGEVVTLSVCYRRMGRYLTKLGNVHIGPPNPSAWTTDFVPRLGTRPTFTFVGENLSDTDAVMLVPATSTCLERDAIATGTFRYTNTTASGLTTSFHIVLLGDGMQSMSNYTVCYRVASSSVSFEAYTAAGEVLTIQPGGPNAYISSNTPMQGRAMTLSFNQASYPAQVGDEVLIACPGCSCYDANIEATVVYGVPYGQLASLDSTLALRVGFNVTEPAGTTQSFPVCYRIADSGFAQVGGPQHYLTPAVNSPSSLTVFPVPTYQGQRMHYNFTTFTTLVPGSIADEVMLVLADRLCWENETANGSGIVIAPSTIGSLYLDAAAANRPTAWWLGHVPSLGPNTPTTLTFPLDYLLCYRQGGQDEFVSVPFPYLASILQAADPATFTTAPESIEAGMYGIQVTFPGAADGDTAYAVEFTTLTDTVCDDAASIVLSPLGPAYPTYALRLPGNATVGSSSAALCYIKANATVAEVPQLLAILEGNPSGYTTNATLTEDGENVGRSRQYIAFTISGTGLNAAVDSVVFTEGPCAEAADPPTSTTLLARMGDMASTADGTEAAFVAQFILPSTATPPARVYMCYSRSGVWREVGGPLTLEAPQPASATFYTPSGTPATNPRAGQHLYLELVGANESVGTPFLASVIAGGTPGGAGTWCHNFTAADVLEPGLIIDSPAMLQAPVWQTAGASRLCTMTTPTTPWSDVGASADAADLPEVGPPNPASMDVFPYPPRVGQRVTLTFHLIVAADAGDVVKVTAPGYDTSCESAASVPGFPATMDVTLLDNATTSVTLTDETDTLLYRSFNATGDYRVCYWSATESAWSVVGGTVAAGTVTVEERVPQSWRVASGEAVLGRNFTVEFLDELGQMNAAADVAWAAPAEQNCAINPYTTACARCIIFPLDATASNTTHVYSAANVSLTVGSMNVCYLLDGATAAQVPGTLDIANGPIECLQESTVMIGQDQRVTFRVRAGEDTSLDTWRVSFYGTTSRNCEAAYAPGFVAAMARQAGSTSTSVSYDVIWPVNFTDERYTICYSHNGEIGPICTCGQIDTYSGECYVETVKGSPESFTPSPSPTYVGETVTLTFAVTPELAAYPPTAIKFVAHVDALSSCSDVAAFTPPTGTTPTRVSDEEYVYSFKHDYALGSSRLLVCALSDLSTSYIQVASTVNASEANPELGDVNLLWIRPFMALSSFPSLADYLRAMQSLNLTFTHQSQLADDVVGSGDTFTFVSDPYDCVESYIATQDPTAVMSLFVLDDTAFITTPAGVYGVSQASFSTNTIVTFNASGVGSHYLCYRLAAGTWAPVLPQLAIGAALTDGCTYTNPVSPSNTANVDLRAMQYIRTVLSGDSSGNFAALANVSVDAVRVVPQGSLCVDDQAVVYTGGVASPATPTTPATVDTIAFATSAGTYKLCYRFGGVDSAVTNWSPACVDIDVIGPTPVANHTGCLNQGQSLDVDTTHETGFNFAAADTVRYVAGGTPCLYPDGTAAAPFSTIFVGDATQSAAGYVLGSTAAGATQVSLPYILLGSGVTSVRLCYTDAAGNQFAVPLDTPADPTASFLAVLPRQPAALTLQSRLQLGQRIRLNFTAARYAAGSIPPTATSSYVLPWLDPYAVVPSPLVPGPVFDGTYDAATMWPLSSGTVYRDGRCAAAVRAGSALTLNGVYGSGTPAAYTIGAYDPTASSYHIACYRLAACHVADVGSPLRVLPYNPATTTSSIPSPRRGQLFDVVFTRDTTSDSALLTPGQDRGAKVANLASCWTLSDTAGSLVTGTTSSTAFTAFFPAEAPASATPNTTTRSCYHLVGGSWSEVPNGVAGVLAANPAGFATTPATARAFQLNTITFTGTGLGGNDRVKVIPLSLNCSEDSVPPTGIVGFDANGEVATDTSSNSGGGGSSGWQVTSVSADGTTAGVNLSSTITGEFSVCYRLETDTVWTLVYGNLLIQERNPAAVVQTPVSALEGELFTLNFTASTATATTTSGLSANDRITLYFGSDVSGVAPGDAVSITTGPSNVDHVPGSIAFQVDAGMRGTYTLIYQVYLSPGVYTPVWGFEDVVIAPNPTAVDIFPADVRVDVARDLRVQELVSLVFTGWGLVADGEGTGKTDTVKLIDASAGTSTYTDAACRSQPAVADIFSYPLYANGTHSVQVVRAQSAAAGGSYWICYKLNGGQFHAIGGEGGMPLAIRGTASPSGATSAKLTGGATVADGEAMLWTVANSAGATCSPLDILFYSDKGCDDVPYYVFDSASLVAATPEAFPWGAAYMNCTAGAEQLMRVSWTLGSAGVSGVASEPLSLCYLNATATALQASPVVSVLQNYTIAVTAGVPSPLSSPVIAPAQTIFTFELDVNPTASDYAVLVTDPDACQGTTAPSSASTASLFVLMNYNATTALTEVTTAVATTGTYYVCYAHQSGECGPATGRECARIVGTVISTTAAPQDWSMSPAPVYTSGTVTITFVNEDGAAAAAGNAEAWLTLLPAATATATTDATRMASSMGEVATACTAAAAGAGTTTYVLAYNSSSATWGSPSLNVAGSYALCYRTSAGSLVLFPPVANAGPDVLISNVTSALFPVVPTVGTSAVVVLQGGGLSQEDDVIAVALPTGDGTGAIPADICSNTTGYSPRVYAEASTTGGQGKSVMLRDFTFTETGEYVLCYLPAALRSATTTTSAWLITEAPFSVDPRILSVTVVSEAQIVALPIELQFVGDGLQATDLAALVYIGNIAPENLTAEHVCGSTPATPPPPTTTTAVYTAMTNASTDGTTALFTTTPAVSGDHMVCFAKSMSAATRLLPTRIAIREETAASAAFVVQPGSCQALLTCSVQPSVTLLNASGVPTASPLATVTMQLADAATGTILPAGYLTGGEFYSFTDDTTFEFFALRVATPGNYTMVATITLVGGGATLEARSNTFTVTSAGTVQDVASVNCTPADILPNRNTVVQCVVDSLVTPGPTNFTITPSTGIASACLANGTTSAGLARCRFTVAPPSSAVVNYIAINVVPESPYESWPLKYSPVVERLPTQPETATTITCAPNTTSSLPSGVVRAGTGMSCIVQGRATVDGVMANIVALPETLDVTLVYYTSTGTALSTIAIDLGEYPQDPNGAYSFSFTTASTGAYATVVGQVVSADGSGTLLPMTNSPLSFAIVGTPAPSGSTLTCVSAATGSSLWLTPLEAMSCALHPVDASGAAINALGNDFTVSMPEGGSAVFLNPNVAATQLNLTATAPPTGPSPAPASVAATSTSASRVHAATAAAVAVQPFASTYNYEFTLQVLYTPSGSATAIAGYTGTLVYVTGFAGGTTPTLPTGTAVTIGLLGSGLDTLHRYVMAETAACTMAAAGAAVVDATATAGTTTGSLSLSFTVPQNATTLYICFAPSDARTSLQLLRSQALPTTPGNGGGNGGGGGDSSWTTADLALLIVGVVFLFLLFVLLIILLIRLFCCRGGAAGGQRRSRSSQRGAVPMPPRANDRFLYRPAGTASSTPPPPHQPPLQIQQQTQQLPAAAAPAANGFSDNVDSTRIRVNIQDTSVANNNNNNTAAPIPTPAPLAQADPAARHADPLSSSAATLNSLAAGRKKRKHRRSSSTSASTDNYGISSSSSRAAPDAAAGAKVRKAPYVDLDLAAGGDAPITRVAAAPTASATPDSIRPSSLPPLPPPPPRGATPPARSATSSDSLPRQDVTATLPPPPPPAPTTATVAPTAPPPSSGPYQHLHSSGTPSPSTSNSTPALAPAGASDNDNDEAAPAMAGPFVVAGHTSRPMVSSRNSSIRK